jgi:hypothetical protein
MVDVDRSVLEWQNQRTDTSPVMSVFYSAPALSGWSGSSFEACSSNLMFHNATVLISPSESS